MPMPAIVNDTIAAIATATGLAGIGVVRISGSVVPDILEPLLGGSLTPRIATHRDFLADDGSIIDTGLAIYFPAPASFTGENVLELQGHGGKVVLEQLLKRCLALGARLAQPGEFTRRALMNGKLDLAQAESIVDLIHAQSEIAAKNAVRSLKGDFSEAIDSLVQTMTTLRAMIEASFDFPEDEIDPLTSTQIHQTIKALQTELSLLQTQATQGALLREGARIALIGAPNVGKSSLMNALAADDIAIVDEAAGTTRDALRESILVEGIPLHIVDTAGLRITEDRIEKAGIARTWSAIHQAHLALVIVDRRHGLAQETKQLLAELPESLPRLKIYNKIDLTEEAPNIIYEKHETAILLSAKQRLGIDLLRQHLLSWIGWQGNPEGVFLARERHLEALRDTAQYVEEAAKLNEQWEFIAEALRLAQQALNRIHRIISNDHLLDEIFSKFCIGK